MPGDLYAKFASGYDAHWTAFNARTHAQVLARLPHDLTGKRLLDLVCGTGSLTARIIARHPAVASITGVDASASMLRQARARRIAATRTGQVAWVWQRPDALDFRPATFDIVVCVNTFHYFREPVAMLRRIRRVLRPDGLLILEDYAKDGLLARYFEWAIRLYDPAHQRAYALAEAEGLLPLAGWPAARYGATFRINTLWRGWIVAVERPPAAS
jgi:ubiquinone/menaquinone biosynthesis C-methylase UbiE